MPIEPYVVGRWAIGATVNLDYHVEIDRNFYSVPFMLVRKRVDVFITASGVQIFHRGERAASHVADSDDRGHQFQFDPGHRSDLMAAT